MNTFSFNEALEASVQYFSGDTLAAKVFIDKYALRDNNGNLLEDTPAMMHRRLAKEFARIESKKFNKPLTEDQIFELFDHFRYVVPQGSPMFGIGNNHQIISLSSCFVVEPPQDSYGGIMRCDEHIVQISKRRGGTGTNLSSLRPYGATTRNASKASTGVVSFAQRYSNSIREVGQEGRRGALMLMLNIHHPDSVIIPDADDQIWKTPAKITLKGNIENFERDIDTLSCYYDPQKLDFASMKLDRKRVTGANVSLALTDEFLNAVEKDTDFEKRFPVEGQDRKSYGKINARNAWRKIIHMAWQSAEPGLLFWDRITSYNAVDCYADVGFKTVSTNPCSEIPLCAYDSCRLLVLNLFSFVENPFTSKAKFNMELFCEIAKIAQRLMDDIIDLELEKIKDILDKIKSDPEAREIKKVEIDLWEEIKKKALAGRRTGLGVTGLADMLAALNIKYASKKAISFADEVFCALKHAAFESSCAMAKEIGPFPVWSWEKEKNSEFLLQIKKENPELYHKISKYGRRNIGLLTLAPTGSVSIETKTSSGGEPVFAPFYLRRKKVNPGDKDTAVDFVDEQGDSWQHFKVYHPPLFLWMEITGETDITKSPYHGSYASDIDWESRVDLQAAIQKHIDHAISSTVNLPASATEEDVAKIYNRAWKSGCKGITVYREGCRSGVLVNNTKALRLHKTQAPKRPKDLKGELFATSYQKEKLYVAVGFYGVDPYEVFVGYNSNNKIEHSKGIIRKQARGKYVLIDEDGDEIPLNNGKSDDNGDALARMISCSLRHGADIGFITHQLEKTKGDLMSFSKVIARVLKKFISDGTRVQGEACPACGQETLQRQNGCVICTNCGASKCS